jgi:hypothetical protein
MLIKRVCETNGEVNDCFEVISASQKYRQSQDAITGFIRERIIKVDKNSYGVSKTSLNNVFKDWFQMNFGNRKAPKLSELLDGITKQFGPKHLKTNKWYNIQIKEETDEDVDAEGIEHEDDIEYLNKL